MKFRLLIVSYIVFLIAGCYPEESVNVDKKVNNVQLSDLDLYIQKQFTDAYGIAIRYKYDNNLVQPNQRVTPPKLSVVRPMLDFIEDFWINPYFDPTVDNGGVFFEEHVPAEIVMLGGLIYNSDGTVTLGLAEAGARITFTNVNAIDIKDDAWRDIQLNTVYHEFAHTVHQLYKLPNAFESISPAGYTGPGSWFTLSDDAALQSGFVSPYATSNPNEDFAETVSHFLYLKEFNERFMVDEDSCIDLDCASRNAGRESIRSKVAAIKEHYLKVTGVDLEDLRTVIQDKINNL